MTKQTAPALINCADFAADIHRLCTTSHYGAVERMAQETGRHYTTVHSNITRARDEGAPLLLDVARAATFVTGSRVLCQRFEHPGMRLDLQVQASAYFKGIEAELGDVTLAAAALHAKAREALTDDRLTADERAELEAEVRNVEKQLADVKALLDL